MATGVIVWCRAAITPILVIDIGAADIDADPVGNSRINHN